MIISIFCLIVGLFQKGFLFVSFIFNVYGVIFSVQAFPSWLIQSPSAVKESSLQNHVPVSCLWRQTRIFFSHTRVYLLAKGCISPLCRAWCCTIVFISTDACFLLKMFSKWCGGTLNCEWVIFLASVKLGCWLCGNNSKNIMAGFAPEFQQDDFRTPQTVSRLRQYTWEWEFALERVAFIDTIV